MPSHDRTRTDAARPPVGKVGLAFAFTCTFASSGTVPAFSATPVIPSGAPVLLVNFHPVGLPFQRPPAAH